MIHFSRKILDRVRLLAIGLVITLGVAIDWSLQGRFDHSGDRLGNIVSNIQLMLIAVFIVFLIYFITKNVRALRDPDRLNKLHIAETDERNVFIEQKNRFLWNGYCHIWIGHCHNRYQATKPTGFLCIPILYDFIQWLSYILAILIPFALMSSVAKEVKDGLTAAILVKPAGRSAYILSKRILLAIIPEAKHAFQTWISGLLLRLLGADVMAV